MIGPVVGALVVLGVASAVAWRAAGGSWENIATPSMGAAAPVGSLVFTRPTTAEALQVGDVVRYQPPSPLVDHTITHRVVAIEGAGPAAMVRTRGDVNGAVDPWPVRTADLRGKVEATVWGGGWLLRGLPMLVLGLLVVWVATRYATSQRWRIPLRVLGVSVLVSAVTVVLKPFVGAVSLGSSTDAAGTHIALVSVGLLPSRFTGAGGGFVDLSDGEVGVLTTSVAPGARGAAVTGGTHMPWWLWIVMVTLWLAPMAVGLAVDRRRAAEDPVVSLDEAAGAGAAPRPARAPRSARVRRYRAAAVGTVGLVVLAISASSAASVFTSRGVGAGDTAASNPYATCREALSAAGPAAALVWPLDADVVGDGAAAHDVSGHDRAGVYVGGVERTDDDPCPHDTASATAFTPSRTSPAYVTASPDSPATGASNVFSASVWFKTGTVTGGRLIGWSDARTGRSAHAGRQVYMTDGGRLVFGVRPDSIRTITSSRAYDDQRWHQVVASLSGAGMVLYVDGAEVAADPSVTSGADVDGYWRVGYDDLDGWPDGPRTPAWTGTMGWAAVYTGTALTPTEVSQIYATGL